jgi:hypothetical protein
MFVSERVFKRLGERLKEEMRNVGKTLQEKINKSM